MPLLELIPFGVTDPGKVRENNEDALLVGEGRDETLFAVADGIGGFEAGEVASSIAVDVLSELEPGSAFETAMAEANRRILASGRGDDRLSGMGTTVVAVRFGGSQERPTAEVAHVGDSRAYLLRGGELKPVTEDHSLVAELVRSGDLTRAQAAEHPQKNLITRALGAEEEVEVDTTVLPVETGDRFLLCSDGLTDMVPEDRVAEILSEHLDDPEGTARSLLSAALEAGGNDNITILIVDVKEYVPPAPARDDRREARSGTSEMPAVGASEGPADGSSGGTGNVSQRSRSTSRRPTSADAKRQSGRPKPPGPRRAPGAPPQDHRQARQGLHGYPDPRRRPDAGVPVGEQPVLLRVPGRRGCRVSWPALRSSGLRAEPRVAEDRPPGVGDQRALRGAGREPQALHGGPGREGPRGPGKVGNAA